jgi:DNA polymerase-3 subunit gamma/tau
MFMNDDEETPEKEKEDLPLNVKYRPDTFRGVLGQDEVIKSLSEFFPNGVPHNVPHAFLFVGNPGTGKTTLARIIIKNLGITPHDTMEVDAALHTGVDDMRSVIDCLEYKGMGPTGRKGVIIDECHMLSKSAWNSILKQLEDAPKHVFWVLCTTEDGKIPKTVRDRCHPYTLNDVKYDDLCDLLEYVMGEEKITLPKDGLDVIVRKAEGSPRTALVCLSVARACSTVKEIIAVLKSVEDSDVTALGKILVDRQKSFNNWERAKKILEDLKDSEPESIRIPIVKYLRACIIKSSTNKDALYFDELMTAFLNPTSKATGAEELLHIFAQILLIK